MTAPATDNVAIFEYPVDNLITEWGVMKGRRIEGARET